MYMYIDIVHYSLLPPLTDWQIFPRTSRYVHTTAIDVSESNQSVQHSRCLCMYRRRCACVRVRVRMCVLTCVRVHVCACVCVTPLSLHSCLL